MHAAHTKASPKALFLQNFMTNPYPSSSAMSKQKVGPINAVLKDMAAQDSYRKQKTPHKPVKLNFSEILQTSP
jgi:hypothetical protein